jgi:hypothetical protein
MSSSPINAKAEARKKAEKTPLENAKTLRGIYDDYKDKSLDKDKIDNYRFPAWVLEDNRWTDDDTDKHHKFKDTIVVYDNEAELNQVKELVEEREPVNIGMVRNYNENNLEKNFGWKNGAYRKLTQSDLYPNIGIYCHARVTNGVNPGVEEKNVHVMNLIGYAFDSIAQPDYIYFLEKYGNKKKTLKILNESETNKLKQDLIQRYRKIWLKACYICKLKDLKNLWYYGVGNGNFALLLPEAFNKKEIETFYDEIFAPAFGIDPDDSKNLHSTNDGKNLDIPINFCKKYGIEVLNLQKLIFKKTPPDTTIPNVLFNGKSTPDDTLYINAWDPWSIIGNGNAGDTSLDGFWGRNSNMSVLGWSMTNSQLLPDITGGASAETSKILSMKQILAKIEAKDKGSSKSPPPTPPTPSCTIDAVTKSIQDITPECQQDIFGSVPSKSSEPDILKKHLSVLRTDTQYATDQDLPPGSATIVDLNYYRKEFNYPADRVKLGNQYVKKNKGGKEEIVEEDVNSFNKEISFVIQAAPAGFNAVNISNQSVTNSVYNCLYLANANGVKGIAFPIIGGNIFFSELKITKNQLYKILLQGVADYFNDFRDSKIEIVLFAGSKRVDDNDDFSKTFDEFVGKNKVVKDKLKKNEIGIFSAYYQYNNNGSNTTKITALVNAANTKITFNGVGGLALGFKNMLGGVGEKRMDILNTLHSKETGLDEKIFTISNDITKEGEKIKKEFKAAVDAYIKNPSAAASPPPPSPPPPPKPAPAPPKKSFTDALDTLEGQLTNTHDTDADISSSGITLPDFLYPPSETDASKKKNLNSAEPNIKKMIEDFESAETGDDTNFYLGACRSIQAAYELEMLGVIGDDSNQEVKAAKMRAKLLLNLRKNSLLLKVPTRWDYATIKMGEEPALTPEQMEKEYNRLQQECAVLKSDTYGNYITENAYELAEKLIPLDEKIEIDKLQKKIELYEKYLPKSEIVYKSLAIADGFTCKIKQSGYNCGRAALANFFGDGNKFIKGFDDGSQASMKTEIENLSPYELTENRPDTINLASICKLSQICESFTDVSEYEETTECRIDEDYSIRVMVLTLHICGFYKFDIPSIINGDGKPEEKKKIDKKLMMCVDNKYVVGFIILQNKSHWVNYKRVNIGSNDDLFYFIDSGDCGSKTDNGSKLLTLIYDYHKDKGSNKITKVIPIIRTTDDDNELQKSETKRSLEFDIFKTANSSMSKKQLNFEFNNEYLPYAFKEVTNIEIWEYNTTFNLDESKKTFTDNQNIYKWKLFMKEVTSKIQIDEAFKTDENKLKVMFYLSNFPADIISSDLKEQILNSSEPVKTQITQIFVDDTKDNINKITYNSDNSRFDIKMIQKNNIYLSLVTNSAGVNIYTPSFDAKDRFYYNLNNNNNTYDKNIDTKQTNYRSFIDELKKKVDSVLVSLASPGGGGFKPAHNSTTNYAKSKHNTSFKASSSNTKGKSHNRSHTQRVK